MKLKNPIKMMKLTAAALALLVGSATAQEVFTKPVGYETLTVNNGFNYLGLRLHEPTVTAGAAVAVDGATVTVPDGVAGALDESKNYLFEVVEGDAAGAVLRVITTDPVNNTLMVSDTIDGDFFAGERFIIRPVATLASVFGAANEAGLDAGSGGPVGADQVWIPNADSGGFDKFYYDNFNFNSLSPTWTNVDTGVPVRADFTHFVYTDGIIILGAGTDGNTVSVIGEVKLGDTSYALYQGFNYISSVTPVGATLATMFGEVNEAGLAQGNGGPVGADQVLIPNGSGFSKYYYDAFNFQSFAPTWSDVDSGLPVDATTISLDDVSGLVILNNGDAKQVVGTAPSFYNSL